ncbi:MAG TPA: hypothetical protein VKF28_02470 [Candidatus Dormibacteraeota bacterium]|nr:hypothetical protein [Candidatus Dormibacteraeota bacterium]
MKRLIRLVAVAALSLGWQAAAVPAHAAAPTTSSSSNAASSSCRLGNGVQHVINIVFDNTHFTRDNPNVPSDLEQMPALLNFLKGNGTLLANEHTPLIAHTATDILTSLTGVYGDRMGVPISNSFRYYLPNKKTSLGVSFAYWTAPIFDPTSSAGTDMTFNMLTADGKNAPAPWVPFTRAGCNVGGVSTANIELENTNIDIPTVFGATSPEAAEVAASDPNTGQPGFGDFVGIAIHCAQGNATCASSAHARPDLLPDEPGGYNGFQGLFGHKYVAPAIGGVTAMDGTSINAFPGFDTMPANNTLGYVAQMQEHGVPVTYGYISDGHAAHPPFTDANPWASGEANYVKQLKTYDDAFAAFFARLAKDGINRSNSVFVFTSDEGDHMIAGPPSPANCDGVNVPCNYALKGEVAGNLKGLTKTQFPGTTTDFTVHSDSAPNVYINGNLSQTSSTTRDLERAAGLVTATNPYTNVSEVVDNYLADQAQMKLLHMQTADPKRNSTFTMFAKPDYFLFAGAPNCNAGCISVNPLFNWNHGDIAPEINTTWLGVVGPDVRNLGVTTDVWTDHSDIRPTLMALTGLQDDYAHQGRPIAEIMTETEQGSNQLAAVYKQINAPVGQLSLDSIRFATRAMLSTSSGDQTYTNADATISGWSERRDALAAPMIALLDWTGPGAGPQNESQKAKLIAQGEQLLGEVHAAAS